MTPAQMQASILERLTGETGEPSHLIDTAHSLCERGCAEFAQSISDELGASLQVELGEVDIVRLRDAMPTEGTYDVVVMAASAASPDALIMTLDPDAASLAVGLMFGADPEATVAAVNRALSATEMDVAAIIFDCFARALDGSGDRGLRLRFPLPAPIPGQDARKLVVRDGPGVRMRMKLVAPGGSGYLTVSMPQRLLLKPRGEGGAANERSEAARPQWASRFNTEIMRSQVRLEATLPMGKLTLGQIASLAIGDVLPMPKTATSDARLSARGRPLYVCELGKLGDNFTVRIGEKHESGQTLMEAIAAG